MPMTGKYTNNYFNDKSDVGCVCMLNDRFSSSDEIFADNHNFSQFKLKGKFHCDGAAADAVERLQEITAYLLVSGGDGKLRPTAEVICSPLLHESANGRLPRRVHALPVSPFYFLYHTPCLQCRVRVALLSIDVKWKQEECKVTLARLRRVDSFRCAEPR